MSLTLTLERGGGEVSGSGTQIELEGTGEGYSLESVTMNGDTQQQTYSGKNLLFCRDTYNANGVDTVLQSDGSIVCTGRTTASWGYNWRPYQAALPKTIPAGTYTFSRSGTTTGSIAYVLYDSAKNQIASFNITSGNTSVTVTTTVDAYYDSGSVGQIGGTGAAVDRHYYLQFEASSTPTTFEKYVGGTASPNPDYPQVVQTVTGRQVVTVTDGGSESQEYEINLGKNLNGGYPSDYSSSSGGISYVNNADGTISVAAGTTTSNSNSVNSSAASSQGRLLRLSAGTYTVSGSTSNIRIGVADSAGTQLATSTNGIPDTFTINTETLAFVRAQIPNGTTVSATTLYPQLEKGSATTYAPYFTPIELCKIGTYQDYIYKSGDDWYVHKEIGKLLADVASGYIGSGDNYTNISYFVFDMAPDAKYYNQYSNNLGYKCTHATPKVHTSGSTWDTSALIGGISMDAAPTKYWLGFQKGTTLADMKSYLSGMLVYYPLATPTDTIITNSALIAQLDALSSAQTYDGITIISVTSQNLASSLEVTAEAPIRKTYTEVEIGSPFTIADVEGKSSNTTLDGNVYVDWAYNKKQYSFNLFNLTPQDYADIRAYYDYQFSSGEFPTITVPELDINKLPVYMEISSRNIINQCLLTDKLTIKFRETVQP